MDEWMTSQLNVALICKLSGSLDNSNVIGFLFGFPGCLCNQTLADVRSTGAGIKCLYCSFDLQAKWVI